MLRIEKLSEDNATVTLKLDGRIVGQWVAILEEECTQVLKQRKKLILDCADVSFIGREGIEMLGKLKGKCVQCVHCSPFVQAILSLEGGKDNAVSVVQD